MVFNTSTKILLAAFIACTPGIVHGAAQGLVTRHGKAERNTYSTTYIQNNVQVICIRAHFKGNWATMYRCSPENAVAQDQLAKEFARLHDAYDKQERIAPQ